MSELTDEEKRAFIKQWSVEAADYLIGQHAPYFIPKPWSVKRDVRDGKRGILDGIQWAQEGRAIADVEIVLKAHPYGLMDQSTDDERLRFDEIVAEDEELATCVDEYLGSPRWHGWMEGVQLVFDRWNGKPLPGPSKCTAENRPDHHPNICRVIEMTRPSGVFPSEQVKVKAAGMPCYHSAEDYAHVLEIMEDASATFVPATYEAFRKGAEREERELKARGVFIFPCHIKREHFLSWCRREGFRPCYLSSVRYANVLAYNIVHVSSVWQLGQIAS
jgi:hypothetical protein